MEGWDLNTIALYEVRAQLGKTAAQAEFFARRNSKRGLWLATSYELAWFDNAVRFSVTFRVQKVDSSVAETEKRLRKLLVLLDKLLAQTVERLKKEGIEVVLEKRLHIGWGSYADVASVEAFVRLENVDAEKLFGVKGRRWRILGDSETWAGGARTSELKALEKEVERGEEALELEGPAFIEIPVRKVPESGWIKLHEAVLKYGIPLLVLDKLGREGRIQLKYGIDERGRPMMYVNEEEVKALAEMYRPKPSPLKQENSQ